MATVLLGQRRMGKTEIFKRVANRLFFEQDHTDPKAAVPVFFSFPDEKLSREAFALKYTENFVRWYTAFRLNDPGLVTKALNRNELVEYIRSSMECTGGGANALDLLAAIETGGVTLPEERALQMPKSVSDWDDSTIVMFLDEILAVDISSGFIWAKLSDQVRRWIDRANEYGITKWILYLAAAQEKITRAILPKST